MQPTTRLIAREHFFMMVGTSATIYPFLPFFEAGCSFVIFPLPQNEEMFIETSFFDSPLVSFLFLFECANTDYRLASLAGQVDPVCLSSKFSWIVGEIRLVCTFCSSGVTKVYELLIAHYFLSSYSKI